MSFLSGFSPLLLALFATLFTYLVTALGAASVFFFQNINRRILDLMMGFAGGVMIAASFWSLLAPAIELLEELGRSSWLTTAMGFGAGGLFVMGSDILLSHTPLARCQSEKKRRLVLLVSAVTLHNIPEGLAVGVAFGSVAAGAPGASVAAAISLALGIGLQNFPEGVCVALPLRREGASCRRSFFIGQASGMVEPVAGVLGALAALTVREILPFALTFSAGAMIAVVCSELIPESFRDNKTLATAGVLLGFILMMVLDVAL